MTNPHEKAIENKKETGKPNIDFYKKNVYGNEMRYLHDEHIAAAHKKLTGQTTLGDHHIAAYTALGHEVRHVPKN